MNELQTPVYRHDYQPAAFLIDRVELDFTLDAQNTLVRTRLLMRPNPLVSGERILLLDGEKIELLSCHVNGELALTKVHQLPTGQSLEVLPYNHTWLQQPFVLEMQNLCHPASNTHLAGLYQSGNSLITQCEAQSFRRITYFVDRPDVMARYRVTLRANPALYPVLLSNGNLVAQRQLDDGQLECVWDDPFPKPSYLFALVAGNFVCREKRIRSLNGKEHLLQIYSQPGQLHKTDFAMQSLVKAVRWDEQRFGRELDLERFMIVVAQYFNMGAMENKGLNIFDARAVYASPKSATDDDYAWVESVIAHEYLHNWTGNRITCRDWFQLSLKEGLTVYRDQEFSHDQASDIWGQQVQRILQVRNLRTQQFAEDAGPMAHPVRPDQYIAMDNFYTATVYEKGAEVIRMMATICGKAGFRRGMDLYFERHDGQAVTCDDFAQAIADANPTTFAPYLAAFKRWYDQAGTPEVSVSQHYQADTQRLTLTLRQQAPTSMQQRGYLPWVIPIRIGLLGHSGESLPVQTQASDVLSESDTDKLLILHEVEQTFVFEDVEQLPTVSLLRGFSAPIRLQQQLSSAQRAQLLLHDPDPFQRWEAGQTLLTQALLETYQTRLADNSTTGQPHACAVLTEEFIERLRIQLQDRTLHPHYLALLLSFPDEATLFANLDARRGYDPALLASILRQAQTQLGRALLNEMTQVWLSLDSAARQPNLPGAPARALRNTLLNFLLLANTDWHSHCLQVLHTSHNLTDSLGALKGLLYASSGLAEEAIEIFYQRFGADELVLDKWFAAQASRPNEDGQQLTRIRQLLQHPQFQPTRPSRLRSVLWVYMMKNLAAFHHPQGYELYAEQIPRIDAQNPGLAARLARALDHWATLVEPQRSLARAALETVLATPQLSADTREVVSRALS